MEKTGSGYLLCCVPGQVPRGVAMALPTNTKGKGCLLLTEGRATCPLFQREPGLGSQAHLVQSQCHLCCVQSSRGTQVRTWANDHLAHAMLWWYTKWIILLLLIRSLKLVETEVMRKKSGEQLGRSSTMWGGYWWGRVREEQQASAWRLGKTRQRRPEAGRKESLLTMAGRGKMLLWFLWDSNAVMIRTCQPWGLVAFWLWYHLQFIFSFSGELAYYRKGHGFKSR